MAGKPVGTTLTDAQAASIKPIIPKWETWERGGPFQSRDQHPVSLTCRDRHKVHSRFTVWERLEWLELCMEEKREGESEGESEGEKG